MPCPAGPRARVAALALLPALAAPGVLAAPRLQVRLVAPVAGDVVEGLTPIEAEVTPEGDVAILKVDFYVDGVRVGWRDDPPYRIEWDAGGSLRARQVRAVAYAGDGKTYEAAVLTRELRVDYRERVAVVNVFATVRDFGGDYAGGLSRDDFRVFEDGKPQTITHFANEDLPLSVALVVDVSSSMRGERLLTAREAAERFAQTLEFERDRALVLDFATSPRLALPLTDDGAAVLAAIRSIDERPGGTALYDAVIAAADALRPIEGRKAVIVLTDGRDEAQDGLRPGSAHTFEQVLERAHQADAILYPIGIGKDIRDQKDFHGVRTVGEILDRFASETGGRSFFAVRVNQLRRAYENVAEALRHQYNLGYSPTNARRDGTWRSIRVEVPREGYTVIARSGYYAPSE